MGRELEYKYLCDGMNFADAVSFFKNLLGRAHKFEEGSYVNAYFKTPGEAKYLRFSINSRGDGELTVKVADKGNTIDRKEWNHGFCKELVSDTLDMFQAAFGDPTTIIWSFAEWYVDEVVISVVVNQENPKWVFLEVEAQDLQVLNTWATTLAGVKQLNLKTVKNSMYDIFVEREGVKL